MMVDAYGRDRGKSPREGCILKARIVSPTHEFKVEYDSMWEGEFSLSDSRYRILSGWHGVECVSPVHLSDLSLASTMLVSLCCSLLRRNLIDTLLYSTDTGTRQDKTRHPGT